MQISKTTLYIILAMILFVVVPIVVFSLSISKTSIPSGKYDAFAACLTQENTKMYGAYWCPNCQNQKGLFGDSFEKVTYIECSLPGGQGQTDECNDAGITGYPTWEFADSSRLSGELPLETLAAKSGCNLEGGESNQ